MLVCVYRSDCAITWSCQSNRKLKSTNKFGKVLWVVGLTELLKVQTLTHDSIRWTFFCEVSMEGATEPGSSQVWLWFRRHELQELDLCIHQSQPSIIEEPEFIKGSHILQTYFARTTVYFPIFRVSIFDETLSLWPVCLQILGTIVEHHLVWKLC